MKQLQTDPRGRPDFLLLILTLLLVGFGLVMVFSASSNIAATSADYNRDALFFTKRQLIWVVLGFILLLTAMNIRYNWYKKGYVLFFIPVVIMLILVPIIGETRNGARSWFGFGSFGIQPTEFAKLAIVLYLGAIIVKKGEKFREFKRGLLPVMATTGVICGLILLQPDIGSTLILAGSAGIIILAGGANLKQLFVAGVILSIVVTIIVSVSMIANPDTWAYRIDRFTAYANPLQDEQDSGYNLSKSLQALGHGGLTGAGFGNSVQKLKYLPFPYNDFIFAVIAEEFGFIGSLLFLLTYLFFIWRGLVVALRCPDIYGTVVGVGIMSMIAVQAFVNIGGVTGAIPITGVTLPFISYGGSSMLVTLAAMGVLLSISREDNRPVGQERKKRPARQEAPRFHTVK
ncbi:stage V sporulation protein E [Paenibacillus darwinianus]|uniref:Stage V sporulation protein E n=1 Tax=Paenibacillus darwinianus TaxID=1380763 RepID=A0A9W5S0F2_9BACL|nr:putative lipid II flippase FtsW [Paenibacillus darwinianus]EXX88084.1 stage V sporulation protein E [Paenibacillus darwinianus]EXX88376.1 stage V sporulation protein E [Paenibacillus darwinianus]EXX89932.1 stage V sporulation protein E [Paenibacillus darwinianus]